MASAVYLDECVDVRLAPALARYGFVAHTAAGADLLGRSDGEQLHHATRNGLVVVTHDGHDFRRLHRRFTDGGRAHGGIIAVRRSPLPLLVLRVAMLLDWLGMLGEHRSRFFTWGDLQFRLTQGERVPGCSEADTRIALGIADV